MLLHYGLHVAFPTPGFERLHVYEATFNADGASVLRAAGVERAMQVVVEAAPMGVERYLLPQLPLASQKLEEQTTITGSGMFWEDTADLLRWFNHRTPDAVMGLRRILASDKNIDAYEQKRNQRNLQAAGAILLASSLGRAVTLAQNPPGASQR